MPQTVLGIFNDAEHAESAIDHFRSAGYDPKEMSIVMQNNEEAKDLGKSTGANVAGGAATGATTGAIVGGIAGLLIGIGAIAIPGIGGLLIGGPLAAALGLGGAAATTAEGALTGALAGGLVGALVGLGIPREHAERYDKAIKAGGVLLAVPTRDGKAQEAQDIFTDHGASDLQMVDMPTSDKGKKFSAAGTHHANDKDEAQGHHAGKRQGELVNPIQIQKFLKHVDYPASKDELIKAAKEEGADSNVLYTLEELPDKQFDGPTGVSRAIGDIE